MFLFCVSGAVFSVCVFCWPLFVLSDVLPVGWPVPVSGCCRLFFSGFQCCFVGFFIDSGSAGMDVRGRFNRCLDSLFSRLGMDADYLSQNDPVRTIRIVSRCPDRLYELGEGRIHSENPLFDFRVSEVSSPQPGDRICFLNRCYMLEDEPLIDQHHLLWSVRSLLVMDDSR